MNTVTILINASNLNWLIYTGGAIVAVLVLAFLVCLFIAYKALHIIMKPSKRTEDFLIDYENKEKEFDNAWLDIPYIEKWLDSEYGYKLHGKLYINKPSNNKLIFLIHGHNSCSIGQLKYLNIFLDLGYDVFIPDHRYSGKSEGDSITFGHYEKHDIVKWLDLLQEEYKHSFVGAFGESMGGATAIMFTAMDKRVKFLIDYCGYADFTELIKGYVAKRKPLKVLIPFLIVSIHIVAKLLFNVKVSETNSKKSMKNIKVPTLIIHSKQDELVIFSNAIKLKKANPNAETVFFEKAIHARSLIENRKEYTDSVNNFVKKVEKQYKIGE